MTPTTALPAAAAATRAPTPGFSVPEPAVPDLAVAAAPSVPTTAPVLGAGLFALQAAPEPPDARARRHGRALLARLGGLQRALLRGEPGELDGLAAELAALPPAEDAALQSTLAAIALRVRVELARRGHTGAEAP